MSSNFIVFPFRAVSGLFFSSLERQREKNKPGTEQRAERRPEEGGRARVAARCVTNTLYRLARYRRISPSDGPSRAVKRRPPGRGRSGRKTRSLCWALACGDRAAYRLRTEVIANQDEKD